MSPGRVLAPPLVAALRRMVHDRPEWPGDADLLFDSYHRVGRHHVMPVAFRQVLGDSKDWHTRIPQFVACLDEMLRQHALDANREPVDSELASLVMQA